MTKQLRQTLADQKAFDLTLAAPRPNIYDDDLSLPCRECGCDILVNYDGLRRPETVICSPCRRRIARAS